MLLKKKVLLLNLFRGQSDCATCIQVLILEHIPRLYGRQLPWLNCLPHALHRRSKLRRKPAMSPLQTSFSNFFLQLLNLLIKSKRRRSRKAQHRWCFRFPGNHTFLPFIRRVKSYCWLRLFRSIVILPTNWQRNTWLGYWSSSAKYIALLFPLAQEF
jgi:hypothetical protein